MTRSRWGLLDAVALVLIGLEVVLTAVLAVGYGLYAVQASDFQRLGWGLAGVLGTLALGLAFAAWGFSRGRRWATSAVVTWQLMQGSLGVWAMSADPMLGAGVLAVAIVVAVVAVRRHASWIKAQESGSVTSTP